MKIIIAGGRDFDNYTRLKKELTFAISKLNKEDIEIVGGGAKGADALGERFANDFGLKFKEYPADWEKFGKGAGFRRNCEMSNYADALIAFWDEESRGTQHMINQAKKKELQIRIVNY